MQSVLEQKTIQLARGLAAQKEFLIKAAIDHCIGRDWTIADITGRGEFKIQQDNTEIFSFDGRDLIRFYYTSYGVDNNNKGIFMRVMTDYRLLYA